VEAGRIKASYRLSLADSILLVTAIIQDATIVTSDHHEMDAIQASENMSFCWVR